MSPARIVAVTRLVLDVMHDLADKELDSMGTAEADFAMLLIPHMADLEMINSLAMREMNALAPALLAEAYPAPG
jgi:hypothetical protein